MYCPRPRARTRRLCPPEHINLLRHLKAKRIFLLDGLVHNFAVKLENIVKELRLRQFSIELHALCQLELQLFYKQLKSSAIHFILIISTGYRAKCGNQFNSLCIGIRKKHLSGGLDREQIKQLRYDKLKGIKINILYDHGIMSE